MPYVHGPHRQPPLTSGAMWRIPLVRRSICVTVNGEIYNHQALKQLVLDHSPDKKFRTASDCEVCAGLCGWGGLSGLLGAQPSACTTPAGAMRTTAVNSLGLVDGRPNEW